MKIDKLNYIFICGCSRSGTSTFADLLRNHEKIIMGRERYGKRFRLRLPFTPALFTKKRFCLELYENDCHHKILQNYYKNVFSKFEIFSHIGDKIPKIYEDYSFITTNFPNSKFIFLLRNIFDVAQSFENRAAKTRLYGGLWPVSRDFKAAVNEWNLSLKNTLTNFNRFNIMIIEYEYLYKNNEILDEICHFLGLTASCQMKEFWNSAKVINDELEMKRNITLSSEQKRYIASYANFDLYQNILEKKRYDATKIV